ncbi:DUF6869 domain-containing protein [Modestobacter sp. I12A-02662]|uniref:DUF6869 domain-containing protein n=1 Tax=Modestobacter sp. I12A-02662 TaxID=1730496 RepID=UPI0034E02DF7
MDLTWADAVPAYRRHHELSRGGGDAGGHRWALDRVEDAVRDGDLPVDVLDAMVRDPDGDAEYLAHLAAGPLEDLLAHHTDAYADAFTERCAADPRWVEALGGVWLEAATWDRLPAALQRIVPEPCRRVPAAPGPHPRAGRSRLSPAVVEG